MHAIVRSYGTPKVLDLINHLSMTGLVHHFTVVTNATRDHIDTPKLLEAVECSKPVVTIAMENYGWSKALNAAINSLPPMIHNRELLMIVSNEVLVIREDVERLKCAASRENASCGYCLFDGRYEPTYRLPRNTYIIWERRLFEEIGLFDESLDNDTGMEDYEMVLRSFRDQQLLPFLGPKGVKLGLPSYLDFEEKLKWESRGVQAIEERYSADVVHTIREHINVQAACG